MKKFTQNKSGVSRKSGTLRLKSRAFVKIKIIKNIDRPF